MTPRATVDFETRSACPIKSTGSWRYSLDPTTEVLCLAYRLPYWAEGRTGLWHPAFTDLGVDEGEDFNDLAELFDWIGDGGLVEAHNAWFERGVWVNICVPKFGWPAIGHEQWRCSAAKAAAHALPRGLGGAADALRLDVRKDEEGAKVMKSMSKPRKPVKAERTAWGVKHAGCPVCAGKGKVKGVNPETGRAKLVPCGRCRGVGYFVNVKLPPMPTLWHESPELLQRLWDYCRVDVLAEEAVSHRLPDLSPDETTVYLLDQAVNERGFELDTEAIDVALDLIDGEFAELNAELATLTNGQVVRASQRARMLEWLSEQGVALEDTTADTIAATLERTDLTSTTRRALEVMQLLGKSSTAKFEAMKSWVCPDSRVHGGLLYHGATTGRWTGAGVQPHNFPRGSVKDDPEVMWALLKTRDRQMLIDEYGSVMEVLSSALRGAIVAAPGKVLYVADYASIEARVLLWHADDQDGLDLFRRHEDVYCDMAASIYGRPITKADKEERQLGKVAVLGLGYQMGAAKFVDSALALGGIVIAEDSDDPTAMTARKVVDAYRTKYWRVKELWWAQEKAAIRAVQREGVEVPCGKVTWVLEDDFLYCTLPSGRRLAYPEPAIVPKPVPWGGTKPSLTFMGVNPFNRQWQRQTTYGGSIVENVVQATARDLMAAAMLRCEQSGTYQPILSVHDEMIAEAIECTGDTKEFEALMAECPPWAQGIPVECEGYGEVKRYRK